jgi:hypothetical protein
MLRKVVFFVIAAVVISGSLFGGLCLAQQKKTLRSFRLSKQARAYVGTREAYSRRSMLRTSRYRKASSSAKKKAERSKTQQRTFRSLRKSK